MNAELKAALPSPANDSGKEIAELRRELAALRAELLDVIRRGGAA